MSSEVLRASAVIVPGGERIVLLFEVQAGATPVRVETFALTLADAETLIDNLTQAVALARPPKE